MAFVISVEARPEPPSFEEGVRKRGRAHLEKMGFVPNEPLPVATELAPYWRDCLKDLYKAYGGTCAYLGVFFERVVGGATVDHYVAKSTRPALAYEWGNFRLACSMMNTRKRDYEDVLDPFKVANGWFRLELVTGRIHAAPDLTEPIEAQVTSTIRRLGLDDAANREMRARSYRESREKAFTPEFLRKMNPFVWEEARRQGLL